MFSAKTRMKAIALAGAAFGLGLAGAAQAGVVVASSGPSASQYPKGKKLDDNDRIVLKDGDSVTILDAKGTRVLTGPGTRVVGTRGAPNRTKFAMLTRQRSATRARTGAIRGTEGALTNSNLWYVDTSISGTMCLADPSLVRLWRPTKEGVATYSITAPSGGTVNVLFDDGDTDAPWDTQLLPLSEDVEYTIRGPGGVPESKVSFALLESPPTEPEGLAAVLIEKGCTSQLDLLASAMAMPEG
ncbi:MAG: hypothetical protein H6918_12495 [Sphingomonadaceae bacterium]|nr:hypothetical protein [Sphingomonadaceae bacterium]